MDLKTRTVTYVNEDMSWLGSAHGTATGDTITLDLSKFTAGTHYPNGFLPAGICLGKITATGAYGLYDNALATGVEVMVGHLLKPVVVASDNVTGKAMGSLFWHGEVIQSKLPANSGIDANGIADVIGRIRYV